MSELTRLCLETLTVTLQHHSPVCLSTLSSFCAVFSFIGLSDLQFQTNVAERNAPANADYMAGVVFK